MPKSVEQGRSVLQCEESIIQQLHIEGGAKVATVWFSVCGSHSNHVAQPSQSPDLTLLKARMGFQTGMLRHPLHQNTK